MDTQELLLAAGHRTEARVHDNCLRAKVHLIQTMKDDRAFAPVCFRPEDPWTGRLVPSLRPVLRAGHRRARSKNSQPLSRGT